ncbi:hypothetical protein KKE45_03900 [Patescibacteria group bacterium]|nr:hypothetical protein [Patescibacteria group bacterium]
MIKKLFFLFLLFTFFSPPLADHFLLLTNFAFATTIDQEIAQITKRISELETAIGPLKEESSDIQKKIKSAKNQIYTTEKQVETTKQKLIDKEADLEVQKLLLSERVRRLYKNTKKFNPLIIFFSSSQGSDLVRQYSWYQSIINQDTKLITTFNQEILDLNSNKAKLENQTKALASIKKSLEDRFGFLSGEIKKAEDYKDELTKKQQALIAEKTAMFNTSVGDISSSQDPASRADFNPGFSPAFAAFSFGAPHRKGMSQFGAFGRSKQGQGYENILKAYYGNIRIETVDTPPSINTSVGSLPFEDNYLVGIAEMPAKWGDEGGMEALKAQAIAARTYALSYTGWRTANRNAIGSICTTEACQVYSSSRFNNPGLWKQAVQETRGKIIVSNSTNDIFSTMYASTAGGALYSYSSLDHSTPQIWDSTCNNQSCWPNDAYEKISDSPWYYKGWYKTRSNLSCGRSHPWLNQNEFSDVLNAVLYYSKTNDSSHLSQIDSGGCFGGNDPNAWSYDELRRQITSHGGPISAIHSIHVDYSTGGYTHKVRVETDKGGFTFDGDDFKKIFILRAPGAITIKSSLFNIEKK